MYVLQALARYVCVRDDGRCNIAEVVDVWSKYIREIVAVNRTLYG